MAGCSTCSSLAGADGKTAGCRNNGGCLTGGCNKKNVFDWLSNMDMPPDEVFDVIEVRFKNGRKEFFRNTQLHGLVTGDAVVVDVPNGHHIGYVSLQGELVRLQMRKRKVKNDGEIRKVYRVATAKDMEKWEEVQNREMPTLYRTRQIIQEQELGMKLTDIEYQADNTKATFYYSAEDRVDFRELIKVLASEFKIRVEMRQISLRQEAGRLGGIGSCGRELCCSTWLSDFKSVSTSAARYQNLALNPSKLSGQCGRLKCCLNYELDTYMDALSDIPEVKVLKTQKGDAKLQKTDIFRKIMWFGMAEESNWVALPTDRVAEIKAMNEAGEKPESLLEEEEEIQLNEGTLFLDSDLDQLDTKYKKSKKKKKKKKPGTAGKAAAASGEGQSGKTAEQARRSKSRRRGTGKPKAGAEGQPKASDKAGQESRGQKRGGQTIAKNKAESQQARAEGGQQGQSRSKSRNRRRSGGQKPGAGQVQQKQGQQAGNKAQNTGAEARQDAGQGQQNRKKNQRRRKPSGNKGGESRQNNSGND